VGCREWVGSNGSLPHSPPHSGTGTAGSSGSRLSKSNHIKKVFSYSYCGSKRTKLSCTKLGFIFVGHENMKFQVIATTLANYNIRLFFAYIDFLQNSSLVSHKFFASWRNENIAILKICFCQNGICAEIKKAPMQTTAKTDTSSLANEVSIGICRSYPMRR